MKNFLEKKYLTKAYKQNWGEDLILRLPLTLI